MRSIFSTVLFSVTLAPTAPHAAPFSLKTSFWGSMNTMAVSLRPRVRRVLLLMLFLPVVRVVIIDRSRLEPARWQPNPSPFSLLLRLDRGGEAAHEVLQIEL